MKISIITVSYNSEKTIEETISSVISQSYPFIEYIIIDGKSTDGTLDIIKKYSGKISKIVSEKDNGIYDAMNKGIKLSSGDIVGILNADDIYANDFILETVIKAISKSHADSCYGDLIYVRENKGDAIVRYWQSCVYNETLFRTGWMPPHPTFFVKKWVYEKYGGFNLTWAIATDYEIMLRFMEKHKIKSCYIPQILVKMRVGGFSNNNIFNVVKQNVAIVKILKENKIRVSPYFFCAKIAERLKQYRLAYFYKV